MAARSDPRARSEAGSMTVSDVKAVEAANARFYRALSRADLPAMEAVWSHADDVACLHPGWPLLRGWDDVRASW